MFRNNVVNAATTLGMEVEAYSSEYGRGVVDVTIVNNTVINPAPTGTSSASTATPTASTSINNLYLAQARHRHRRVRGVFVYDNDLTSFDKITNNVWPVRHDQRIRRRRHQLRLAELVGCGGYKTPTEWDAYGVVNGLLSGRRLQRHGAPPSASRRNAGIVWAGVFTDMNGKMCAPTAARVDRRRHRGMSTGADRRQNNMSQGGIWRQ